MATDWTSGPADPKLAVSEVHVWRASLDVSSQLLKSLDRTLTEDERTRASRFAVEKLQTRFIVRRGLLRTILASYLGVRPGDLQFGYGTKDKPHLVGDPAREDLRFNETHSHGLALFAVARGRDLGIDLEEVCPQVKFADIAGRYFAPSEAAALAKAPVETRLRLFFEYWTSKEAWIKAMGGGLSIPLDRFEIELKPGVETARVVVPEPTDKESQWFVHQLTVGSDHVAALAVDDLGLEIRLWDWGPELGVE